MKGVTEGDTDMNANTKAKMDEILEAARAGQEIIPMFFQPRFGRSNTVSAAIRMALKQGFIVQSGVDGLGKPKYRIATPNATHNAPKTVH